MLKKLATGAVVALAGLLMIGQTVSAQPPPRWDRDRPVIEFRFDVGPRRVIRRPPPPPVYRGYCDVRACAATYRSFRAWDCTYQPYYGPRRLCTVRW